MNLYFLEHVEAWPKFCLTQLDDKFSMYHPYVLLDSFRQRCGESFAQHLLTRVDNPSPLIEHDGWRRVYIMSWLQGIVTVVPILCWNFFFGVFSTVRSKLFVFLHSSLGLLDDWVSNTLCREMVFGVPKGSFKLSF